MSKWRQYLYLLVNKLGGTYPLRRIDASTLFCARNQVKEAVIIEETPLPRPHISFTPLCDRGTLEFFGFFGHGRKKSHLVAVEHEGGVSRMYDLEHRTMHEIASPSRWKFCNPVSLAVGEALYVMDREPLPDDHCSFEVLTVDDPSIDELMCKPNSSWHCLQPLPFVLEPGYERSYPVGYTVDGSSNILVSTPGIGTYSFDTSSRSWRKAGDWELPFCGRAEFLTEYNVWLGFSSQDDLLCYSSDVATPGQGGPALDMVWEDLDPPRCWVPRKTQLVRLGSNKFCVAKFFERIFNAVSDQLCIPVVEKFAVLTGLVLKPTTKQRGLVMVKHRSHIYRFEGPVGCFENWTFIQHYRGGHEMASHKLGPVACRLF